MEKIKNWGDCIWTLFPMKKVMLLGFLGRPQTEGF
jgi:hypothetical protein